ncbi:tRNA(Ile)-lysidine synthase [Labeo rohita]|uniref:tRNA(Ile)-lysidine synthase n=1 Tax=Labeo rohita TaxID=84645 RepID=A0ABQ8LTR6_LABRO|nr:tRNA(Ile)-lysidine synthase [Labeo rohita]
MAEFSSPPLVPILPVPGEPPIPWASWFDDFIVYLEAVDYSDIPNQRMIALLRHCVRAEGKRIYIALGHAETYKEVVALLANHFMGHQRKQHTPASNNCTEIRHISVDQTAFKMCTVLLCEVTIPLLMDTNAAASLLNATLRSAFTHRSLVDSEVSPIIQPLYRIPLASRNLTLNAEKCTFITSTIDFVGFRLTPRGNAPLQ